MTRRVRLIVPAMFFLVVWTLTTHGKFSNSGDEPHYLMVAESILSDGDLDVANNYRNGDGRWFGNDGLTAGPHARPTADGRVWSTHDIGVPVVILPVYAAATRLSLLVPDRVLETIRQPRGLFAYSLVSLSLALLTACGLALLITALSPRATPLEAGLIVLVVGLSPPVLSHAFLVFPETIALFVVCATVWLALLPSSQVTRRRAVLVTAAIGLMPWLHRKYSFFVVGLVFALAVSQFQWLRTQSRRTIAALGAVAVLPQLALHVWTMLAWHTFGGPQMLDTLPFEPRNIVAGSLGLIFDRERGLVSYAPIYLIAPACWTIGWRRYRSWLVPVSLLFVPMSVFAVWSAGFSPAARYLVPLVPLMVLPAADALEHRAIRTVALVLTAFQACILAVVWQFPRTLWPKEQGTNEALSGIPWVGRAYEHLLPSMLTGDSILWGMTLAAGLAAGTAALVWGGRRGGSGADPERR